MAKNWTMKEATESFVKGDKEAIADIGRRFPLVSYLLAGALSGNVGATETLLKALPDQLTCNKVNGSLKSDITEKEEADQEVEEKDQEVEENEAEDTDEATDYDSMSGKELSNLVKTRKLHKMMKEEFGNKWNKANMVACLKKADADTDEDDEEDEEVGKYDDMSAVELFKECKKRGLKVKPKQNADFYIEKLEEDDKKDHEEDDEDDWGEDEEVEEKVKPSKKVDKKQGKKAPAKKVEDDEDDDDDDWDI